MRSSVSLLVVHKVPPWLSRLFLSKVNAPSGGASENTAPVGFSAEDEHFHMDCRHQSPRIYLDDPPLSLTPQGLGIIITVSGVGKARCVPLP